MQLCTLQVVSGCKPCCGDVGTLLTTFLPVDLSRTLPTRRRSSANRARTAVSNACVANCQSLTYNTLVLSK